MATYINRSNFSGSLGSHFFLDIYYDLLGQDISGNYSSVRIYAYVGSVDGYSASGSSTPVYIEGNNVGSITSIPARSNTLVGYIDRTIYHDGSGNGSFNTNASVNTPWNKVGSASVSGSATLPSIPRYASVYTYLSNATETSVQVNWSSDSAIDQVQYRFSGGGWIDVEVGVNKTSGSYTINGLSPGTSYSFDFDYKRRDSQLWSYGAGYANSASGTTYNYPYISSTPNFVIGNPLTIGLYNPLGRSCTIYIITNDNVSSSAGTITGSSIYGFNNNSWKNIWYESIPNSPNGSYKVRLYVNGIGRDTTVNGGVYSVTGNEKPIVSTVAIDTGKTLVDGNTSNITTTDLTGDNKKIIKFISDVEVSVSATGQNSATISSYATKYGSQSSISGTPHTYNNVDSISFTGLATDSRNLTNSSLVNNLTLIDYIKPTIENIELYRDNQTSNTLKCRGNGNYFNDSFGSQNNSLVFKLRYKASDSSTWSDWTTKVMTIGSNNTYSFDFQVGTTFDYTKTYNFEFSIADKCMTVTDSEIAKAGIPIQGLFENFIENFGIVTFSKGTDEIIINGDIKISGSNKYLKNL